jgi:hypothetical protein
MKQSGAVENSKLVFYGGQNFFEAALTGAGRLAKLDLPS